jgi:hypothetical protein
MTRQQGSVQCCSMMEVSKYGIVLNMASICSQFQVQYQLVNEYDRYFEDIE